MPIYNPAQEHVGQESSRTTEGQRFSVNINDKTAAQLRELKEMLGVNYTDIMHLQTDIIATILRELYCQRCRHCRGCRHNKKRLVIKNWKRHRDLELQPLF